MATTTEPRAGFSLGQRIVGGVVGGVAGGLVFGAMMAAMGMLPMVASVVGSNSALIGFLYHMFNSVVIGAIFGLLFGAQDRTYRLGAALGLLYGAIWWVLGPMSLVGHLLYGLVTGLVYGTYTHRRL